MSKFMNLCSPLLYILVYLAFLCFFLVWVLQLEWLCSGWSDVTGTCRLHYLIFLSGIAVSIRDDLMTWPFWVVIIYDLGSSDLLLTFAGNLGFLSTSLSLDDLALMFYWFSIEFLLNFRSEFF